MKSEEPGFDATLGADRGFAALFGTHNLIKHIATMMKPFKTFMIAVAALYAFLPCAARQGDALTLASPNGELVLMFALTDSVPCYSLDFDGQAVILPSRLGFELKGSRQLTGGFVLVDQERSSFDETWEPVWGEEASIRNHYNELLVKLQQPAALDGAKPVAMHVRFRVYDDGMGFRYEFPMENALTYFMIQEELTQFALTGDHTAWWIPGDYSTQEFRPTRSRLSQVRELTPKARTGCGWPNTVSRRQASRPPCR